MSTAIFNAFSILCAASADPSAFTAVCDGGPTIVPKVCPISNPPWLCDENDCSVGSLAVDCVFKLVG